MVHTSQLQCQGQQCGPPPSARVLQAAVAAAPAAAAAAAAVAAVAAAALAAAAVAVAAAPSENGAVHCRTEARAPPAAGSNHWPQETQSRRQAVHGQGQSEASMLQGERQGACMCAAPAAAAAVAAVEGAAAVAVAAWGLAGVAVLAPCHLPMELTGLARVEGQRAASRQMLAEAFLSMGLRQGSTSHKGAGL